MRQEFSKPTQRAAHDRAKGQCEGEGPLYGLPEGVRCTAPLSKAVQYDHLLACSNGGDNSLENCRAVCVPCHAFKTAKVDIPRAAKTLRLQDKKRGIKKKSRPIPGSKASGLKRNWDGSVVRRTVPVVGKLS